MTPEVFFEKFGHIADAPSGVKKLRELILQLAVQGKLVPQDPSDEPASVLLEKIAEEKARLVAEGKVKKSKLLPPVDSGDIPFDVPKGWLPEKLGNVVNISTGFVFKSLDYVDKGIFVLRVTNIDPDSTVNANKAVYFPKEKVTEKIAQFYLNKGDILVVMVGGSLGKVGIVSPDVLPALMNQNMWRISPVAPLSSRYFFFLLKYINGAQLKITSSTHGHLSMGEYKKQLICLPPVAEQQLIVAKVDELMTQCDELEAKQVQQEDLRVRANDAALAALTSAREPDEFQTHWTRITENFDHFFDRPEPVAKLRAAILQLAVQGKLVPQDPNDEPAKEILDKAKSARLELDMSKKDRDKVLAEFQFVEAGLSGNDTGKLFIKARCLCDFITKGTTPAKAELLQDGEIPFLKVYNIVNNILDFSYRPAYVSREVHVKQLKRSKVFPGDVLMNIVGPPLGKVAIVTSQFAEWNINQALAIFRPLSQLDRRFLHYILSCDLTLKSVLKDTRGTAGQDNLSLEQCRDLKIPLPSLTEQKRIVAKADELMALCDELEAMTTKAREVGERLASAAVSALKVA